MQAIAPNNGDREELHVIAQCINGKKEAWESLFHRYQPRLLAIIKRYLGRRAECGDLDAEEIAASIWYSLIVGKKARLRRYDPSRGAKLLTYLAALARREIFKRYRRAQSRQSRETRVARPEATAGIADPSAFVLQEFLATLTRREREFCLNYLLATQVESEPPVVTACNAWQLRSRILRKLRVFSGDHFLPDRDLAFSRNRPRACFHQSIGFSFVRNT